MFPRHSAYVISFIVLNGFKSIRDAPLEMICL